VFKKEWSQRVRRGGQEAGRKRRSEDGDDEEWECPVSIEKERGAGDINMGSVPEPKREN
jgi:hypothetical protein